MGRIKSIEPTLQSNAEQYLALLEVAESIALHRDLAALFHDLKERLRRVVQFDFLNLTLHDEAHDTMRLHILETDEPDATNPGMEIAYGREYGGLGLAAPTSAGDLRPGSGNPLPAADEDDSGARDPVALPVAADVRRIGGWGRWDLAAGRPASYENVDLAFLGQVAAQVAVAVDNALNAEAQHRQLARERDRLRVVLDVTNAMVSNLDTRPVVPDHLRFAAHGAAAGLYQPGAARPRDRASTRCIRSIFRRTRIFCRRCRPGRSNESSPAGVAVMTRKPVLIQGRDVDSDSRR